MAEILRELYSWIAFVPEITFKNFLEIAIITIVVYEMLVWIKNTRAWTLLKGILFIFAFVLLAAILELDTILWLLEKTSYIAVTAILIIFQPELRKALEQLGSKNVLTNLFTADDVKKNESFNEKTINELVRASFEMGKVKTGALMVIERSTPLGEIERTGIEVDGIVTSQLLINIFEHNTPLHDGHQQGSGYETPGGRGSQRGFGQCDHRRFGGNRTGHGGVRRTASQGSQRRRTEEPSVHID